jgi:hypothetical protein
MWFYANEKVENIDDCYYGFIYKITLKNGQYYIGKKACFNLKKTIGEGQNGRKKTILTKVKSNWEVYNGSSELFKKSDIARKDILEFCKTKRSLTYKEVKWMFVFNVLESDLYLNQNILGKFFKGNLE